LFQKKKEWEKETERGRKIEAKKGCEDERERVVSLWLIQKERESGRREREGGRERKGSE
jgi:hypothetical protein